MNAGEIVKTDIDHHIDENWLGEQLRKKGFNDARRIFCAERSEEKGLFVAEYPDVSR